MANYNANLTTKESKNGAVSDAEMDENFIALKALATIEPIVEVVGDHRYIEGLEVDFNIMNYDSAVLYAINTDDELNISDAGEFSIMPIGAGLDLYAINSNKLPNSGKCILEEHKELKKYLVPTSVEFGDIISSTLTNCYIDGENNVVIWNVPSTSIYVNIILTFYLTLNEDDVGYDSNYVEWLSSPSKLYFGTDQLPNKELWAVCSHDNIETIINTEKLMSVANSDVFDIFGDGSAIEYYRCRYNESNYAGTSSFAGDLYREFWTVGRFLRMIHIRTMEDSTSMVTDIPLSLSGDVPASFSVWFGVTYSGITRKGVCVSFGEASQRYNIEIELKPIASGIECNVYFHKRSQVLTFNTVGGTKNFTITYEAGVFEIFHAGISQGTIIGNANWNDSKGIEVAGHDWGDGARIDSNTGNIGIFRVFSKKLSSIEIADIQEEGYQWLYIDPPLPSVPTSAYYGTIPKVYLNDEIINMNVSQNNEVFTMTLQKQSFETGFEVRGEFKNGLVEQTTFKGYFEYTQQKN